MKRLACALVLAGSAGALMGVPRHATAAPTRASDKLLLSILTPDPGSIGDRLSLDVSFRGEPVKTVELYLDSALVAQRRIDTTQARGIISFGLDTVLLTVGSHDVTVKAYGADGQASVASGKIKVPAADLSAPVRIAYPQNGTHVSGVVPIRVTLDSDLQKLKPYVTFFVDKELKVLRNFPPYEYNWDTTRVSNGWHILEAWTSTEEAVGPTKARPIHVNVNNSGGETKRQNGIPDLRNSVRSPGITLPITGASVTRVSAPHTDISQRDPTVIARNTETALNGVVPSTADPTRPAEPAGRTYGSTAAPDITPSIRATAKELAGQLGPKMAGGAAKQPGIGSGLPPVPVIVPPHAGYGQSTTIVKPNETLTAISKRTGVSAREIALLNGLKDGARLHGGARLIVPRAGSFDVAFNGTPIVFDVQPRIEGGVKLAPFRQIFEHTGGRLFWYGGTAQTVRAINDTREIEIKIGNADATVNNHILRMERTPYVDSGRTIVPLSFIRDSLDVKVLFNEKTGHLLIESNK